VEACPNDALRFGERSSLLKEAHRTIAASKGRYIDRVWGEHEFGGTSVLYISDVDLGVVGWPEPDTDSIPSFTEPLIAKTPVIGMSVMGSLLGINWVIRRRMRLASQASGAGVEEEQVGSGADGTGDSRGGGS
jgi:formate dehydrogenase iron-sulfur subunit